MNLSKEVLFTYSDIKNLFLKNKQKLLGVFVISFFTMFLFLASKKPEYKAEALFQVVNDEGKDTGLFEKILGKKNLVEQKLPISLMFSKKILLPLIKELALQVEVGEQGFFQKVYTNIKHNLSAEMSTSPLAEEGIVFRSVSFEGRERKNLWIRFMDNRTFEVLSSDKKVIKKGTLNKKWFFEDLSFYVDSIPCDFDLEKLYPVSFSSPKHVYEMLLKKIKIELDENADSLLQISCKYKNPYVSRKIVNHLMSSYESFLQSEAEEIADMEVGYLQKKRKLLFTDLQNLLDKTVCFQKKQIKNQNLFPIEEKLEKILEPYHKSRENLAQIEAKLETLKNKPTQYLSTHFIELQKLQAEMEQLKGQKDLLVLNSLSKTNERGQLASYKGLDFSSKPLNKEVVNEIRLLDAEVESLKNTKGSLGASEKINLLILRKKLLEKRSQIRSYDPVLEGIDIKTAKVLLAESFIKLEEIHSRVIEIKELKNQVELGCELSTLTGVIPNPIFQDLIKQASALSLKLKDKNHLTSKEQERHSQEYSFLKKVFLEMLEAQHSLETLLEEKISIKIQKLNATVQDRIDQQIEVGRLKQKELIASYQEELTSEKRSLKKHLESLSDEMALIPDQWRLEKELQLKTKMVIATLDSIGKVLEEKSFITQLKKVQSKPIDQSELVFLQERPLLFFISTAFAVFCFLVSLPILFFRGCFYGFTLSKDLLNAYGQDVLGSFFDKNQVLYEAANYISKNLAEDKNIVSLIKHSTEYLKQLSLILRKRGYKIKILDGSEDMGIKESSKNLEKNTSGLTQGISNENNSLLERISSLDFLEMMHTLKNEYDLILFSCDADPLSLEARATLAFSDQVILAITRETLQDIEPYLYWKADNKKLGFLLR